MRRTWMLLPAVLVLLLAWPLMVAAGRHEHGSTGRSPLGQAGGSARPAPGASSGASSGDANPSAPGPPSRSLPPTTSMPLMTSMPAMTSASGATPTGRSTTYLSGPGAPTTTGRTAQPPGAFRSGFTPTAAPTTPEATPTHATATAPVPDPRTARPTTVRPTTLRPTSAQPTTHAPTPKPTHATTAPPTSPATGGSVTIANFRYAMPAHVAPGARIAVYNADSVGHTLTISSAGIDVVVDGDAMAYLTAPAKPGSYAVTCDYHADMVATLVVS